MPDAPFAADRASTDAATGEMRGSLRMPRQLLAEQRIGERASVHDASTADALGLAGAPIEGPTHFSLFDPLAFACFGVRWFEVGCISAHFSTMVFEGEEVEGRLVPSGPGLAGITAVKRDGSQVLVGSASVDPTVPTALDERRAGMREPAALFIMDQLVVGQRSSEQVRSRITFEDGNGPLYPFSLEDKLAAITEPSPWYRGADNPWGRPILPMEMVSVLAQKSGSPFPSGAPRSGSSWTSRSGSMARRCSWTRTT